MSHASDSEYLSAAAGRCIMFRSLRLSVAFEHLLQPAEWQWLGPIATRGLYHVDSEGGPMFPFEQLQAYPVLWRKAARSALRKLKAGLVGSRGSQLSIWPAAGANRHPPLDYLTLRVRLEEPDDAGFISSRLLSRVLGRLRSRQLNLSRHTCVGNSLNKYGLTLINPIPALAWDHGAASRQHPHC